MSLHAYTPSAATSGRDRRCAETIRASAWPEAPKDGRSPKLGGLPGGPVRREASWSVHPPQYCYGGRAAVRYRFGVAVFVAMLIATLLAADAPATSKRGGWRPMMTRIRSILAALPPPLVSKGQT